MNIQEATKLALERGEYITRKTKEYKLVLLLPTDTVDCFKVYVDENQENDVKKIVPGIRWNPNAGDILADDWEVEANF